VSGRAGFDPNAPVSCRVRGGGVAQSLDLQPSGPHREWRENANPSFCQASCAGAREALGRLAENPVRSFRYEMDPDCVGSQAIRVQSITPSGLFRRGGCRWSSYCLCHGSRDGRCRCRCDKRCGDDAGGVVRDGKGQRFNGAGAELLPIDDSG